VKGKLPLYLTVAVALLALVESAFALLAPARVAGDADWKAAAAEVREGFHDGDLIVFAPYWADQTGRHHLGDKISVEMAGHADADRYPRIWELSIRGAHHPDVDGKKPARETRHGKVTVALYEQTAVAIAYDFTTHSDDARVTEAPTSGGGNETPCYKELGGYRCGGLRIEPRTLEIDYAPRRGILAPASSGRVTRLEWTDIPLGTQLVGYTGLHDYYSRKSADGPVDFKLFVDGRERGKVHHLNTDGWRRVTVDTAAEAGGKHTVRVEISAPNAAWRTFGFHLEARK
jgi:hypothetical protein